MVSIIISMTKIVPVRPIPALDEKKRKCYYWSHYIDYCENNWEDCRCSLPLNINGSFQCLIKQNFDACQWACKGQLNINCLQHHFWNSVLAETLLVSMETASCNSDGWYLQWMTIGPASGNSACFMFTWVRKLRTPPGSWGTPWSGQLKYW